MADSEEAETPPPPYVAVISNGKTEPVSSQNGEVLENGKGSKTKDDKDDNDKKPDVDPVGFLKLVSKS